MRSVTLGATGLSVSPLVFGSLPLGPLQANLSPAAGGRLIRHALEQGVTMLDTAELYGTYPHLRAGLEGYTGPVTIASKTHAPDGATARAHVERALKELGLERLDIVHLHGARIRDPFTERAQVFETLHRLKEEGKIGHVGLSSHYIEAVRKAAGSPLVEVVHPLVNRTGMGILDGGAGEMAEAIALCADNGKGVYAMKALAGGNLISQAREAIGYVAGLPGVHALALGMLSQEEIDANIALLDGLPVDDTLWSGLEQKRRRLQIMTPFCTGCGLCVAACHSSALALVDGKARVDEGACVLCGYCAAACPEFMIRVV
jgi:aryl-alcohol dehydrogenase-like predicted oxidoreductase/Pyruvate/2-oxoacid:ferredoxin oxidoreductase delta subunit